MAEGDNSACIMLPVTAKIAAGLHQAWGYVDMGPNCPPAPADDYHLTLLYFPEISDDNFKLLFAFLESLLPLVDPVQARGYEISAFPRGDTGVPVILHCEATSQLKVLRETMVQFCSQHGIEFSKKYPKWQPHVTLAYSQDDVELKIPVNIHFDFTGVELAHDRLNSTLFWFR